MQKASADEDHQEAMMGVARSKKKREWMMTMM
jgi:hypothetical protein